MKIDQSLINILCDILMFILPSFEIAGKNHRHCFFFILENRF